MNIVHVMTKCNLRESLNYHILLKSFDSRHIMAKILNVWRQIKVIIDIGLIDKRPQLN